MAPSAPTNPLLTTKPAEAALSVQLHPLVILTITDYITRHVSRRQAQPILGAIIGQQTGRTLTLEHAYECKTSQFQDGNGIVLDVEWFTSRLEQYKDVHKAPALDLAAVFMLGGTSGPDEAHLEAVKQVQKMSGNEAMMLLLFHAEMVDNLQGGKLPISLYESVAEQIDGGELETRFRELSFEVETGEAEMIGVDFVATGGGNATAVPKAAADGPTGVSSSTAAESSSTGAAKDQKPSKGKGKAKSSDDHESDNSALSPEDEELIASLTAKANAIKMLNQRLNVIRGYLTTLQSSYLTDAASTELPEDDTNHTLLRSINAMLSRLPLLTPPTPHPDFATHAATTVQPPSLPAAAAKEQQDVHLTTLLSTLTRTIAEAQSVGSKFHVVTREKANKERYSGGGGMGRGGFGDGMTGLMDGAGGQGVF